MHRETKELRLARGGEGIHVHTLNFVDTNVNSLAFRCLKERRDTWHFLQPALRPRECKRAT